MELFDASVRRIDEDLAVVVTVERLAAEVTHCDALDRNNRMLVLPQIEFIGEITPDAQRYCEPALVSQSYTPRILCQACAQRFLANWPTRVYNAHEVYRSLLQALLNFCDCQEIVGLALNVFIIRTLLNTSICVENEREVVLDR